MRAVDFVESYMDAWNHRDPKEVADHLADDGIYFDIPEDKRRTHDELVEYLSRFFSVYRHRYELTGEILTGKDTVAFQYRMCPRGKTGKADLSGPYCGAEFVTLRGDAAMTITDYYDTPPLNGSAIVAQLTATHAERQKYAKSGLSEQQLIDYKEKVARIMQSQQIFLRPDLTLPKLAQAVGCSVNHLSQVINSGFGMSFFDYLNQYRIKRAKELLSELRGEGNAILNIAFMVGFNSNSAFYAAFKKRVGQTPAQYRKSNLGTHH